MILVCLAILGALERPSVLTIVADDVGWPEMPLMPTVRQLGDHGVVFDRAYGWPTCSPSRLSLLFGEYPRRMGIGDLSLNPCNPGDDRISDKWLSGAELFGATHSTALVGKWHLGRARLNGEMNSITSGPFVHGFDTWTAGSPALLNSCAEANGYYNWNRVTQGDMALTTVYATDAQRDALVSWWNGTSGPKYAWLAWSAAHEPYDAPPGFITGTTTRENYEHVVEYMDAQLATVLASIDLRNTYV